MLYIHGCAIVPPFQTVRTPTSLIPTNMRIRLHSISSARNVGQLADSAFTHDLDGFDNGAHNQFGFLEVDEAVAAVFGDDELGSGDPFHPFLVKLQPHGEAL